MGTLHEPLSRKVRSCSFFFTFFFFFFFARSRLEKMDSRLLILVLLYPVAMVSAGPPAICAAEPGKPCCVDYAEKSKNGGVDGPITYMMPLCSEDGFFKPGRQPGSIIKGEKSYSCRKSSGDYYEGTDKGKKTTTGGEGLKCDRKL